MPGISNTIIYLNGKTCFFRFLFGALLIGCGAAGAAPPSAKTPEQLLQLRDRGELTAWARRYEHGEGVIRSPYWAIRLYCQAARRGSADAQYSLGWIYANGRGIDRDDALAAAWFRRAAERLYPQAEQMLARVDHGGRRVKARCKLPLPDLTDDDGRATGRPLNPRLLKITRLVEELAPQYDLDADLVLAVIAAESGFNPLARSAKDAQGLMQLIPATAARFGVVDVYDISDNLHGGMAYLRWLLAYYQGDVELALAGYNAGERAVDRFRGVPPYAETRDYVAKITRRYGKRRHPPVEQVVAPSELIASR